MESELPTSDSDKSNILPLALGVGGIVLGLLGLIFGMSAKSSVSENTEILSSIDPANKEGGTFTKRVDEMNERINSIESSKDSLAMQVEDVSKRVDSLVEQTNKVLGSLSNRVDQNTERLSSGGGSSSNNRVSRSANRQSQNNSGGEDTSDSSDTSDQNAGGMETYTIQPGDTLSRIGSEFGVSWQTIMEANPNIDPNRLQVGQQIVIPLE